MECHGCKVKMHRWKCWHFATLEGRRMARFDLYYFACPKCRMEVPDTLNKVTYELCP